MAEVQSVDVMTPRPLDRLVDVLKRYDKAALLAGLGIQLAVLLTMVVQRTLVLWSGSVYYVHVVPVDPRDLLRGDYVILGYEFSRVPAHFAGQPGEPIYVTLVPAGDGKHVNAGQYVPTPPGDGVAYLKGRLIDHGRAEYGIESFFVQEGKGHIYEDAARSGRLTAEIAVAADGQAALRNLHVRAK